MEKLPWQQLRWISIGLLLGLNDIEEFLCLASIRTREFSLPPSNKQLPQLAGQVTALYKSLFSSFKTATFVFCFFLWNLFASNGVCKELRVFCQLCQWTLHSSSLIFIHYTWESLFVFLCQCGHFVAMFSLTEQWSAGPQVDCYL